MPALTRRPSDNPHQVTWRVYYGDVCVGTIGERAGVPVDLDRWGWRVGFCPGLRPGQDRSGSARTFDEARAGFEADWKELLPEIPEGAFDEWRQDRLARAEMQAKRARGEKLDSEVPSSMVRCVCGIRFDMHKPADSFDHRAHIYAAQAENRHW